MCDYNLELMHNHDPILVLRGLQIRKQYSKSGTQLYSLGGPEGFVLATYFLQVWVGGA